MIRPPARAIVPGPMADMRARPDPPRNRVPTGGTGTGTTRLAVRIARASIRNGRRGRSFDVVGPVNTPDAEARAARQGRTAGVVSRLDLFAIGRAGMAPRPKTWLTPR